LNRTTTGIISGGALGNQFTHSSTFAGTGMMHHNQYNDLPMNKTCDLNGIMMMGGQGQQQSGDLHNLSPNTAAMNVCFCLNCFTIFILILNL
jgi:hypothetical protein